MHLVTFIHDAETRIGVLLPEQQLVLDVTRADTSLPATMQALIEAGTDALASIAAARTTAAELELADVQILAPIPEPRRNVFCIGKNYRDHVKEIQNALGGTALDDGGDAPQAPIFFTKATTAVSAPGTAIPASDDPSDSTDYEGELAIIIGREGKKISKENAMDYIYGYSVLNDVTARRLQKKHQQWFLGKSLDDYCPMGPALVTADEIDDVTSLKLQTTVNGELRQNGSLTELIFDIPTIIETLSATMTLKPGDIIATGTPAGVGMGFEPPLFLKPRDEVSVTIAPLGTLTNPVS